MNCEETDSVTLKLHKGVEGHFNHLKTTASIH